MATVDERIQSILTAIKEIQEHPELLEDGTDNPWQVGVLEEVDEDLWHILEAAEED